MIWAFVDYENVGSLESLNMAEYERVFVFCGPKDTKIKFGALPSNGFCSWELIGVATAGSNNLDFHLAFHLGRFHELADKSIMFHIISNDSGFNGLVNHLKKIGRNCKKVLTKETQPLVKVSAPLSEDASLVVARLRQLDGGKRPRKRVGLVNWIRSQCQGLPNPAVAEIVCDELVKAKMVRESGSNISYEIER